MSHLVSLLFIQELVIPVLWLVPGLRLSLGVPHQVKKVLTPQWTLPSIMSQEWVNFFFALGEVWIVFHLCCFSCPAEIPVATFGEGDISTEAETERQRRSRSAGKTCRLVLLAGRASAPIDFSRRERTRTLSEQAIDDSYYQLKQKYFWWRSVAVPQFLSFCFTPLFRRSCSYPHQRDRSPVGYFFAVPFVLRSGYRFLTP